VILPRMNMNRASASESLRAAVPMRLNTSTSLLALLSRV